MLQVLWIECRRSLGPLLLLASAITTWLVADLVRTNGVVLWSEVSSGIAYTLVLLGPAAAGVGAWAGGRDQQRQLGEVLDLGARHALTRHAVLAAAVGLPLVAGYVIGAVAVIGGGARFATWGAPDASLILLGAVALGAYVVIGYVVGRLGPRWLVAPAVVLAVYFGQYVLAISDSPVMLLVPFPEGRLIVWGVRQPWLPAVGIAWWLVLAAGALAILFGMASSTTSARRRSLALTGASALAGLLVGAQLLGFGRWTAVAEPVALRCEDAGRPEVCVHPAFSSVLTDTATTVRRVLGPLADAEGLPTVRQTGGGAPLVGKGGVLAFDFPIFNGTLDTGPRLAELVAFGSLVSECALQGGYAPGYPGRDTKAQVVVSSWLLTNAGFTPSVPLSPRLQSASEGFAGVRDQVRERWLRANLSALQECRVELRDLPGAT
jgi:hypothetical protein